MQFDTDTFLAVVDRSVTDVHKYFKTLTLDFGGRNWFATGSTLDLSPEGYLIVSVNYALNLHASLMAWNFIILFTVQTFSVRLRCSIGLFVSQREGMISEVIQFFLHGLQTQGNVCLGILDASGASLEVKNIIGGKYAITHCLGLEM